MISLSDQLMEAACDNDAPLTGQLWARGAPGVNDLRKRVAQP
jgi:hypothetical protein